jgi:hypothetical protein
MSTHTTSRTISKSSAYALDAVHGIEAVERLAESPADPRS